MNWRFIASNTVIMLPAALLLSVMLQAAITYPADWAFHIAGEPKGNYPPLAPLLVSQAAQNGLLVPFCLLLVIIVPYILLLKITGSQLAPAAYLYGSGIPFILMWGGFFAQGIMHILMLINMLNPYLWGITAVFGYFSHREWFAAWALSAVAWVIKNRWSDVGAFFKSKK